MDDERSQAAEEARIMEYLVRMTTHVPEGTPDGVVADVRAREAAHSRELAAQGHLLGHRAGREERGGLLAERLHGQTLRHVDREGLLDPPRCGLREINLPAKQPGSSIMPGKVNPVIPEVVNMVCYRVIGSDLTVSMAAEGGQLQLNVFEPVIAACIFEAQTMFINAAHTLKVHCVDGITVNEDVCRHYVEYSIGTVTALNPVIGYDKATELAKEAMATGRGILELVREKKLLTEKQIAEILDPAAMTGQIRAK